MVRWRKFLNSVGRYRHLSDSKLERLRPPQTLWIRILACRFLLLIKLVSTSRSLMDLFWTMRRQKTLASNSCGCESPLPTRSTMQVLVRLLRSMIRILTHINSASCIRSSEAKNSGPMQQLAWDFLMTQTLWEQGEARRSHSIWEGELNTTFRATLDCAETCDFCRP